jgi:tyrosine-protein kinase Etk/Wzc
MTQNNNQNFKPTDETVNIVGEIVQRYLPYWPLFVLTIAIGITGSFFKLRYATPIYQANASIMLKDEQDGVESVLNALEGTESKRNVENEMELLKSKDLMADVVKNLGLYTNVYAPGRVKDLLAYRTIPVTFIAMEPDSIVPTPGIIPFTYNPKKKTVNFQGKDYNLEVPVETPFGRFKIQYNSDNEVSETKQYKFEIHKVIDVSKYLVSQLSIYPGAKQSTIINLKITDPSSKRAEDILNELIKVYNNASVKDKNGTAAATLEFIDNRLKLVINELSEIEQNVETYKSKHDILNPTSEGTAILSSVQNTDQQLAEVNIQLSVLDEIQKYILDKNETGGTVPATLGISDPILLQTLNRLNEAELQLDRLRKTSAENSPTIVAVKSQIAQLKPSLLENIRNLKINLNATKNNILGESAKYQIMLRNIPKKERELLEISRQQGVKTSIYTFLLQKREETALSYASSVADTRLVTAAESSMFPVSPVKLNIYLVGFILGLLAAIGIILMRETYISQVVFRSEIEKATNAKIISEIINNTKEESIVLKDGKNNAIAEQFRALRTSLIYLGINKAHKTILLTSSVSGEGKSFVSTNLAVSFSLTGKKVVLLELDLRKPKISSALNIDNHPGMTDYLAGLANYKSVIKTHPEFKDFDIITAGNIPPNPTELMVNGKLDELMEQLNKDYDYIVLDSPPIGLVTDARLINKYADISLYIVRHKHTPKNYLKFIDQTYMNEDLKNMYIVFNGLKPRGMFNVGSGKGYGAGYGYGSGYGYGYITEDSRKGLFSRIFGKKSKLPKVKKSTKK